jgi:hypothetical protein
MFRFAQHDNAIYVQAGLILQNRYTGLWVYLSQNRDFLHPAFCYSASQLLVW